MDTQSLSAALVKIGMRHGVVDRGHLQKAHDAIADLVDGMHCGMNKEADAAEKANSRHAKVDLKRIMDCHNMLVELGAMCPGAEKE